MVSCRASSECTHRSSTASSCSGVDMMGRVECGTLKGYEGGRVNGSWGRCEHATLSYIEAEAAVHRVAQVVITAANGEGDRGHPLWAARNRVQMSGELERSGYQPQTCCSCSTARVAQSNVLVVWL